MDRTPTPKANLKKYIKVGGEWRLVPLLKQDGVPYPGAVIQMKRGDWPSDCRDPRDEGIGCIFQCMSACTSCWTVVVFFLTLRHAVLADMDLRRMQLPHNWLDTRHKCCPKQ